jgi:hypothetical protein
LTLSDDLASAVYDAVIDNFWHDRPTLKICPPRLSPCKQTAPTARGDAPNPDRPLLEPTHATPCAARAHRGILRNAPLRLPSVRADVSARIVRLLPRLTALAALELSGVYLASFGVLARVVAPALEVDRSHNRIGL